MEDVKTLHSSWQPAARHTLLAETQVGQIIYLNHFYKQALTWFILLSALPFSGWLYRMNGYTKTPVNTVWFDGLLALALGLLVFAGEQAINAVFAISITALYIAYAIPIAARFLGKNAFKPGPFTLGVFVRAKVQFIQSLFTKGLFA